MKIVTKKLGEVGTYINGCAFKPEDWKSSGVPIIRIENLNNPKASYNYYQGEFEEKYKVTNGDILVSWSASLDAYIWNNGEAVLNQHIFKVIPNDDIVDKDFLFFLLKNAIKGLTELVHGATMKHVNKPVFENFEITFPEDKNAQKGIAKNLERNLAEIEKAREATEIQKKEIKFLKKTTLNSLFKEFENKPTIKLSECCSFSSGGTPSKSKPGYWNGNIPWFSPKDMKSFYLVNSIDNITQDAINLSAARLVPTNTIFVVNRSGILAHTLPVGIVKQDSSFNQDIKAVTPRKEFTAEFIALFLKSQEDTIIRHGVKMGATVHSLKAGFIENIDIPLIPIELQNEFCEKVLDINILEANAMNAILSVHQELRMLPTKLLQEAFNEIENG